MKKNLYLIAIIILMISCKEDGSAIISIFPLSGGYGTFVEITVENLASKNVVVKFNQKEALIKDISSNRIHVEVPKGATSGPITISYDKGVLTGTDFEYTLTATITTFAGNGNKGNKDGSATESEFDAPDDIATDSHGNIYVLSGGVIRKITQSGITSTLKITPGYGGISGICIDKNDNLYACSGEYIFSVSASGTLSIFATAGYKIDGSYISFDTIISGPNGSIYAIDSFANRIFFISSAGVITLFAGKAIGGYLDGDSKSALFNQPRYLATDNAGNLYVTDFYNLCIRKITPDGAVTTIAGNRSCGYADGKSNQAIFCVPLGICVDSKGNIHVSETLNPRIRVISQDGYVKTVAGTGINGYMDGPGKTAQFYTPSGMCAAKDGTNNIYICDFFNNRIRLLHYE